MNILLLDDDLFLRDMYADKFKENNHSIVTADNGKEGLSLIAKGGIDVVLLDMIMPTMTGIDFLKQATKLPESGKIKFIVLSNQGEESDKVAAREAGAIGYIVKAESIPSEVVKKVEELVA